MRVEVDHQSRRPHGLIVPSRPEQRGREVGPMSQRVELLCTSQSVDRFVVPLERREHVPVEVVDVRAAGVQLECPLELQFGPGPIEVAHELEEG